MGMRRTGAIAAAVMMIAVIGAAYAAEQERPKRPDVLAVAFHADWCGTCEQLEEPVGETAKAVGDKPVLFVKLDLTNEETQAQAELLAGALGIDEVWAEHSNRTGFVLLIDRESGEVIDRLTARQSSDEMIELVDAALARAG